MYTIYKATNKENGHVYIGFDCNWPYRKAAHKCAVKRGSTLVFHNAIRKYGWNAFDWEILEQSDDRDYLLKEREEYHIRQYSSHYLDGNGYNMTYGGEATLGWKPSEETRRKIGLANSRSTLTENGRKVKSKFTKLNNPMHNEKVKVKHREQLLKSKTNARKVICHGIVYDSIRDASKAVGENYQTLYYWIRNRLDGWSYL